MPADTASVVVLRDQYVHGDSTAGASAMPIVDVMTTAFETDAYVLRYSMAEGEAPRRLLKASFAALPSPAVLALVLFDVDPPGHIATQHWRAAFLARCRCLPAGAFVYWTKNGARIVYLCAPTPITDPDEAAVDYLLDGVALAAATGIVIDPACADVGHLFRPPHGTRDGTLQAHGWALGEPTRIGAWQRPPTTEAQRLAALAWLSSQSSAWRSYGERLLTTRERRAQEPATVDAGRYGAGALRKACELVAGTAEGQRFVTLRKEAYSIGGLVGAGVIDMADAIRAFGAAVHGWAHQRKTLSVITKTIEAGAKAPRQGAA